MASYENLDRLLETERRAASLVDEARAIAARKVAEASEGFEAERKTTLAAESRRLAAEFESIRKRVDSSTAAELEAYRSELETSPADRKAFAEECRRYLEGSV